MNEKALIDEIKALKPDEAVIFVDFMQFALPRVLSGEDPQEVYIAWQAQPEMKEGENNGINT